MNLIALPNLASPIATRITPAMSVATVSPSMPYFCTMPYTITTNAPVGPPICTREPPNAEMMKPATMAVHRPRSGVTPLAMAKAIASGSATMPTITPAIASLVNCARSYDRNVEKSLGTSTSRELASGVVLSSAMDRVRGHS